MTNTQISQMGKATTTGKFLTDNAAAFDKQPAFKKQAKTVVDNVADLVKKAAKTEGNASGYSKTKKEAKRLMADELALHAGDASVAFDEQGRHDLALQMLVNASDYYTLADKEAEATARNVWQILHDNIALVTPDYVTQTDVDADEKLINDFASATGDSSIAHNVSPADTAAFKDALQITLTSINKLLILGRRFKKLDNNFYNGLQAATKAPPVNVHHTGVAGTITHNKQAATAATVEIVGTDKKASTDAQGKYSIIQVTQGTYTLKVTLATGETLSISITLKSGELLVKDVEI